MSFCKLQSTLSDVMSGLAESLGTKLKGLRSFKYKRWGKEYSLYLNDHMPFYLVTLHSASPFMIHTSSSDEIGCSLQKHMSL